MLDDMWILLAGKVSDARRPNEDSHDIAGTDPAFIL